MSIHSIPRAAAISADTPQRAGGAITHGNPPAPFARQPDVSPDVSKEDLRSIAVQRGVDMLVSPSAEHRADARMRGGLLARVTADRWIDRQPLMDRVLFRAVQAVCWIGGGLLIARVVL